jgi:hypothetical protein
VVVSATDGGSDSLLIATAGRHIVSMVHVSAMLICIAFAASDEWHQSFVPDRFFDSCDKPQWTVYMRKFQLDWE